MNIRVTVAVAASAALLACIFAGGVVLGQAADNASSASVSIDGPVPNDRTVLQHVDIAGTHREAVMIYFASKGKTTAYFHTNPGEEIGYVISGSTVLDIVGRPSRPLNAGDSYTIPAGAIHNVDPTTGEVTMLIVDIIDKGKPIYGSAQ